MFIAIFFITGNNINKTLIKKLNQGLELLFDLVYQSIYNVFFCFINV